ncbi:MAG: ISAs1 family transposase [Gemmatimonadales bacterium]|nr:MAG: ISAs1 family transposase [Gemmatimonadales bacterium]
MEISPRREGKKERKKERRVLYRGKPLEGGDLHRIRRIVRRAKGQSVGAICEAICSSFGWYRANGAPRERSVRGLLRRLQEQGMIDLPSECLKRRAPARGGRAESTKDREPASPRRWPQQSEVPGVAAERGLVVRPIVAQERPAWREHMESYHYLGCGQLVGESICYVALLSGQVVGLLGWAAAALKCRARDRHIGWDEATKAVKLHFVANNTRFLLLPGLSQKNLASRILAANLRRLSADWEKRYDHRVLLAETFVDANRFRGTCYRASNWVLLGETRGWARSGKTYRYHGDKKLVFVYPLQRHAVQFLRRAQDEQREVRRFQMLDVERLPLRGNGGLIEILESMEEFRKPRGVRFSLWSVLAIAACATLCGAKNFAAIAQWAKEIPRETLLRLGCRRKKPPSEKTYRRILNGCGIQRLEEKVGQWFAQHSASKGQGIAVDGKVVRGSDDGDSPAIQLLSAFSHEEGTVLAQQRIGKKTNEIPSIKPLLENLDLKNAVVTADAMHTQRETARHIVETKEADYLFTVKDNQRTLRADIELLNLEASPPSGEHGEQGARPGGESPDLGE